MLSMLAPTTKSDNQPVHNSGRNLHGHRKAALVRNLLLLALLAVNLTMGRAAFAQETSAGLSSSSSSDELNEELRVGVRVVEPFVVRGIRPGSYTGFSIELWEKIASYAKIKFRYVLAADQGMPQLEDALLTSDTAHGVDIGIGAITINEARQKKRLDFTSPYYYSCLRIMKRLDPKPSLLTTIMKSLFSKGFLIALGAVSAMLVVNAHILWWCEHGENADEFPTEYVKGVCEAFWWSLSTVITQGCENKAPRSLPGRLNATIWMLAAIVIGMYLQGFVTSQMTLAEMPDKVDVMALKDQRVATVEGHPYECLLRYGPVLGLRPPQKVGRVDEAIDLLRTNGTDAVVYDAPMLLYHIKQQRKETLQILGPIFDRQYYAFCLSPNLKNRDKYRERINEALEHVMQDTASEEYFDFDQQHERWFKFSYDDLFQNVDAR